LREVGSRRVEVSVAELGETLAAIRRLREIAPVSA